MFEVEVVVAVIVVLNHLDVEVPPDPGVRGVFTVPNGDAL
jgi:hypothetical protein